MTSAIGAPTAAYNVHAAGPMDISGDLPSAVLQRDNVGGADEDDDVCDVVEREGAWMPSKPLQVPNAPDVNAWSSSESEDSELDDE
jgi:hypothetical protein